LSRNNYKTGLLILALVFSTVFPVSAAMVRIPFEKLMSNSDTIVTGKTTNVTQIGDYQYFRLEVENYYKNPKTDTILYVKVHGGPRLWVEDQPELDIGKEYLLFLSDTEEQYNTRPVYTVYGLFKGVYTLEGEFAKGHPENVIVTEDDLSLAPPGNLSFAEFRFPENLPVFELDTALFEFENNGGQIIRGKYLVSFKGVDGLCEGIDISEKLNVYVHAGGGTQKGVEVNFTLPGLYDVFLNETIIDQITVYEAGHGAEDVVFSSFRTDPAQPLVNRRLRLRFNVTYNGTPPLNCYYRLVVTPRNEAQWLSIPMVTHFNESGTKGSGYEVRREDDSDLRVVVWYKGQRVVDGLVEVADNREDVPELSQSVAKVKVTREMAEEFAVEAFRDSLIDPYDVAIKNVRKIEYEYPVDSGNFTDAWYVAVKGKGTEKSSGELVVRTTGYTIIIDSGEIVEGVTVGAGISKISVRNVILDGIIKLSTPILIGLGAVIIGIVWRKRTSSKLY